MVSFILPVIIETICLILYSHTQDTIASHFEGSHRLCSLQNNRCT